MASLFRMAESNNKISESLDTYFDRSRKTISQWVTAHINSELQKVNGTITVPIKKPLQDIYDYALLDAHLSSVVEQRKAKVLGEEYGVFVGDVVDNDLTKLFSKQWFNKLQSAVIDSKVYGYNLIEVQDLIDSEIRDIKTISRGNVIPELRAIVKNPYQTNSLIPIDNRNDSDYYILVDSGELGLLNKVVPLVMMKRLTMSMWASHAETFGIPPTILKTDNKEHVDKFHQDLTKFVHSRKIVIGTADSLDVLQTSGTDPHNIYKELIETCNAEISKAIIGQTMTTDNGSSRSQSEVHERVANEISEADREYMTYAINDIVFPKLIALGYRLENATFKYISRAKRSYEEKLKTITTLIKENGYMIDPENVREYLDLPFEVEPAANSTNTEINSKAQKKSPYLTVQDWYEKHSHAHDLVNADGDDIDRFYSEVLASIESNILNDVYFNNVDTLNSDYITKIGDLLTQEVYKAFDFDGDFDNPDFDSEDLEFVKALRKNNYYFVGGKNKALNQSFTELLFDGTGNLKPFNQFKNDAEKVGLQFNRNYLKTEYQTAINNALSARDWQSFEDDDVLRYDAVMDSRTRPEHARLNGLELPKSDRLWASIAPQNSWNCRCRLVVVPNAKGVKLTSKQRTDYKKLVDKDFRFNPGSTGNLFPSNHPYLKVLSKEDKARIDSIL